MSINDQLEQLYKVWETKYSTFIRGGIVNEDDYLNSNPKVLFLLKEVNSNDNGWSLVDLINDQTNDENISKDRFLDIWETVGYWSCCLIGGCQPYVNMKHAANDSFCRSGLNDGLKSIATTNLKKSCGKGTSNYDEILEYAVRDKDLLLQEIDIMNPEIVICGGTFSIISEMFGFECHECRTGAKFACFRERVYIEMPHPKARVAKQIVYAYFRDSILDLMDRKIIKVS